MQLKAVPHFLNAVRFPFAKPEFQLAFVFQFGYVWLDELRKNLMEWRPWAGDLLDAYLEGDVSSCPGMLAEKYGVSLQTTRKYVRQFEQRLKSFLEGVSF